MQAYFPGHNLSTALRLAGLHPKKIEFKKVVVEVSDGDSGDFPPIPRLSKGTGLVPKCSSHIPQRVEKNNLQNIISNLHGANLVSILSITPA
jgi:hypothetical protein